MPTPPLRRHACLRKRCCRHATRAFTLVELVTAASLMTVMMLGVVQIFAIVTRTAGDAEGLQFAMEQGRAFFDMLHRDIQGLTREGYVRIVKQTHTGTEGGVYSTDLLATTSVGVWSGVWRPEEIDYWKEHRAPAAEVVYTRNVKTDTAFLTVGTTTLDNRRGILGRGQWLLVPMPSGGHGAAGPAEDYAKVSAICNLYNQPGVSEPNNLYKNTYLKVWPVTAAYGTSDQPPSLQRVMACGVSEFYVEYLVFSGKPSDFPDDYAWKSAPNRFCCPGLNRGCPLAIRVTIAIHAPDDRKPLPSGESRFRGYAMQEVFWIGDP